MKLKKFARHLYYKFIQIRFGLKIENGTRIGLNNRISGAKYFRIGKEVSIGNHCWMVCIDSYRNQLFKPSITISDQVSIGSFACITCIDSISIGHGCLISEYFYVSDHYHGYNPDGGLLVNQDLETKGKVKIGDNVFIGYRVSIMSGVVIGNYCVIGSHSVVNKNFPDYSMIAGAPAKLIKIYDRKLSMWVSI